MTEDSREPPDDQAEFDRRWQHIVADLGPLGLPDGPSEEPADARGEPVPERPGAGVAPSAWGPRDYAVDDDDEGEFIPPDPPALGSGRPSVVLSAVGLSGAPLALLLAALFWPGIPTVLVGMLIAVMIAGGVGLFLSLPRDRDRGPWGDDGAQV